VLEPSPPSQATLFGFGRQAASSGLFLAALVSLAGPARADPQDLQIGQGVGLFEGAEDGDAGEASDHSRSTRLREEEGEEADDGDETTWPKAEAFRSWSPSPSASAAQGLLPPLSTPPLFKLPENPPEAARSPGPSKWEKDFHLSMNLGYGGAALTGLGLLPFTLAVALHEIWPCSGRECIGVSSAVGVFGLSGLSLFVFGTGVTGYWSTRGAKALYGGEAPLGAVWMGKLAQFFWILSELALTVAIVSPGSGFFWTGALFGLVSIPLAFGQMMVTTLQRKHRSPGRPKKHTDLGAPFTPQSSY